MPSCAHNFVYRYFHSSVRHLLLGMALVSLLPSFALALEMSIIPLNNANAGQLVNVIQAQLGEGSSVSSYQNQIVLNATPEETAKIKTLIETLDISGKQLLISVKNNSSGSITTSGGNINNSSMDNGGIRISKGGITQTTTTIEQKSIRNSGSGQQGIRATEGYPSFITTGSAMAYNQPVYYSNGKVVQNQEWKSAETGFYATAWVNGNRVSIKIEQQEQSFNNNASINNQQLQTQISGKLGEWIAVDNLNTRDNNKTHSLNSMEQSNTTEASNIYLKIELAE